jgi:hypothetical protein
VSSIISPWVRDRMSPAILLMWSNSAARPFFAGYRT